MELKTPRGVKDFLPVEARWKTELESEIRRIFRTWGFQEIITPTFEFFEIFEQGSINAREAYRFVGRDGELLTLRYDLTTPIARMVASRLKDQPKPLRLAYLANVFRYDDVQVGFQREFYQSGVELIGSANPATDAEIIALAITLFNTMGVKDFRLDIGQVEFFHGIMEDCQCQKTKKLIWKALLRNDLVGLRDVVNSTELNESTKKLLLDLPQLRGQVEVLDEAYCKTENHRARQAILNLKQVYQLLVDYGVTDQVYIDLGMVKSLEYYTGVVLEGYVPDIGFTLISGGRYDNLSSRFGNQLPAVGFALGLERLMLVLEQQGLKPANKAQGILVLPHDWVKALQYAKEQRQAGIQVEIDTEELTVEQAKKYAAAKNMKALVVAGEKLEIIELAED